MSCCGCAGAGWLSNFSVGNPAPDRGLALVSAFRWDTGVQVHAANDFIDGAVAVTTGTLGNPLVGDDNAGKQVAGRMALRPATGLIVGLSGARGPFLTRGASEAGRGCRWRRPIHADRLGRRPRVFARLLPRPLRDDRQRLEAAGHRRRRPSICPLRAVSTLVEGRYKIRPGLYAAARLDHLGFSTITGSTGRDQWDAPVTRVEIGGGFSVQRNLLLKLSFQLNSRDGGRVRQANLGAAQIVFWL